MVDRGGFPLHFPDCRVDESTGGVFYMARTDHVLFTTMSSNVNKCLHAPNDLDSSCYSTTFQSFLFAVHTAKINYFAPVSNPDACTGVLTPNVLIGSNLTSFGKTSDYLLWKFKTFLETDYVCLYKTFVVDKLC